MMEQNQTTSRLEILKSMVAQNPSDSFSRYGLAMEYRNAGDLETAMSEFRSLMAANPDYVAAYFHGGQTLERLGLADEARDVYQKGIEAARRTGNQHAQGEMEAALGMLG
jgi:tetratricopeptide (TPR) repeat protein